MSENAWIRLSVNQFKEKLANKEEIDYDRLLLYKAQQGRDFVKEINEDKRQIDFVISTEAKDRDGDTIAAKGWDLKNYKKNPVVLWAHSRSGFPIAKSVKTKKENDQLVSTAQFTEAEDNPLGDTVFRLYAKGFLNATSVGFLPREFEFQDEDERESWQLWPGLDFKKQELLEYSAVPVPSNPEALMQARSKGIDTNPLKDWAEETLDHCSSDEEMPTIWVPRETLERMYKVLSKGERIIQLGFSSQLERESGQEPDMKTEEEETEVKNSEKSEETPSEEEEEKEEETSETEEESNEEENSEKDTSDPEEEEESEEEEEEDSEKGTEGEENDSASGNEETPDQSALLERAVNTLDRVERLLEVMENKEIHLYETDKSEEEDTESKGSEEEETSSGEEEIDLESLEDNDEIPEELDIDPEELEEVINNHLENLGVKS